MLIRAADPLKMSWRRKSIYVVLMVACISSCESCDRLNSAASPAAWRFGTASHDLAFRGNDRSYLLHVPKTRPRRLLQPEAFPLILLLHGSGADGETIRKQSNFDSLAEIYHAVVAYPNGSSGLFGVGSDWNAGECCGAAARDRVDDVAFLEAVIADISAHIPIDARRIYVAGFSDGGRMAYHFACAASQKVAAVGVVSGSLVDAHCRPALPVAMVVVHGTADADVPMSDSALTAPPSPPARDLWSLPPAVKFWAVQNRCDVPKSRLLAPTVTKLVFRSCLGADLVLYTIAGGTHSWPGGNRDGANGAEPAQPLDASGTLMRFFLSHSRGRKRSR